VSLNYGVYKNQKNKKQSYATCNIIPSFMGTTKMTIKNSPTIYSILCSKAFAAFTAILSKIFLHASDKNPLKSLREPQSNRLLSGMPENVPTPGHLPFLVKKPIMALLYNISLSILLCAQ